MNIVLAHFNDAYVPTLAPLWDAVVRARHPEAIVTCGGDVFNPSLISTVTKGRHVPPLLNKLGVAAAALGNHDLDFNVDTFAKLSSLCAFPWLASNIKPMKGTIESVVLNRGGLRIGFFGIVGTDFVSTLNFDASALVVEDAVVCTLRMVAALEKECDVIVALTHCREADDDRIASVCGGKFNLILGGHDHEVILKPLFLFKAGVDWHNVLFASFDGSSWSVELVDVRQQQGLLEPSAAISSVLATFESEIAAGLGKVLAELEEPLDVRTSLIRKSESAVGNWICDLVLNQFAYIVTARPIDLVLINAGSLRGDNVLAGHFTVGDLLGLLPFNDMTLCYAVFGAKIKQAIEAGCSKWPAENGGFPLIGGMRAALKNGKIVSLKTASGDEVDDEKEYVVVMKSFLADGKDGFDCLKGHCRPLMDVSSNSFNFFSRN